MLEYLYGRRVGSKIAWANRLRLILSQTFSQINTTTFSNLVILHTYSPMKMEQTECSETSAYNIQTPGNYPEEIIQHSEQGKSLKSRIPLFYSSNYRLYNLFPLILFDMSQSLLHISLSSVFLDLCLEPRLRISGAIPLLPLRHSMT
jgi:hypothetical protein